MEWNDWSSRRRTVDDEKKRNIKKVLEADFFVALTAPPD